jgi:hypothetical protein
LTASSGRDPAASGATSTRPARSSCPRYPGRGRNGGFSVSAETCRAEDEERHAPVRAVLREWAGTEAVDRRAELTALREEAARLASLAGAALRALREAGHVRTANRIERELGTIRPGELQKE